MEEFSEEIDMDDLTSIDDFIKELEARERDLDISSETVIEIEDLEFDDDILETFLPKEKVEEKISTIEPIESIKMLEPIKTVKKIEPTEPVIDQAKITELEGQIIESKKKIAKMETERTELFELSRRRQTDFDNYKKRTERDKNETFHGQLSNLALQILPVFDNLNRAVNSVSELPDEKTKEFQQFFNGIALVNKQLTEVLVEMGIKPINAVGEVFDPHFHEAVATEETEKFPLNTVVDELLRGYMLGEKVIRPAMVKVSKSLTSNPENLSSETTES